MKVITRAKMQDGTDIQIEDWRTDYPGILNFEIGAYPKSKANHPGSFSPKLNEKFRAAFKFDTLAEVEAALSKLISGELQLRDYASKLWDGDKYADCL